MKKKLIQFSQKPFVRNVIILASGTVAAQIVAMLSSPIITRLYGPEAFGLMGTFMAVVSIVAPIAALTYPIAIVLPKQNQDAKDLIRLSLIITMFISIMSLIILILFNDKIINIFNIKEIGIYLYLIPLVIIFTGLMQVAEQWLIRTKQFAVNARVTLLRSIIINGSKIGIGLFYPISTVLVILSALSNGLKAIMAIIFVQKSGSQESIKSKNKKNRLKELARKYKDFPKYRAPQAFLHAVSEGLPVLMLTAFFGPASAGFYSIGRTVLSMPSALIGQAVGDVFYPRITEANNNKEDVTLLIKKATLALIGVGILPFSLVIVFGPFLFSLVFGSDWVTAGEYARWIALFSFGAFINRPSVKSLPVLNAQRLQLIYTVIWLIVRLSLLYIGYFIYSSDIVAIALFGISGLISNLGLIAIVLKLSKKE